MKIFLVIGQAHMKNPPDPDVRQHQRSKVRESLQLPETGKEILLKMIKSSRISSTS